MRETEKREGTQIPGTAGRDHAGRSSGRRAMGRKPLPGLAMLMEMRKQAMEQTKTRIFKFFALV